MKLSRPPWALLSVSCFAVWSTTLWMTRPWRSLPCLPMCRACCGRTIHSTRGCSLCTTTLIFTPTYFTGKALKVEPHRFMMWHDKHKCWSALAFTRVSVHLCYQVPMFLWLARPTYHSHRSHCYFTMVHWRSSWRVGKQRRFFSTLTRSWKFLKKTTSNKWWDSDV